MIHEFFTAIKQREGQSWHSDKTGWEQRKTIQMKKRLWSSLPKAWANGQDFKAF